MYKYNFIKLTNKLSLQVTIITMMVGINLMLNNKLLMWMTLEISTMSFISMIIMEKNFNSSIMYFIVSFISSTIMFMGLIINPSISLNVLILTSVLIKIALLPFNYWFNLMSKSISFMNLGILMTLMKFIPLNILHMMIEMNPMMMLILIWSMIMAPIMAMNKFSLKLILSYSSIHQTSLMMMLMYMNFYMFIMYFMFYTIITFSLMIMLDNQHSKLKYEFLMDKKMKIMFFMMMISYSYFPPMTTFILKWSLIENMMLMNSQFKLITIIVMLSSFMMIWSYMNFMNNNIYKHNNFNKMFMLSTKSKSQIKSLILIHIMLLFSLTYIYLNF